MPLYFSEWLKRRRQELDLTQEQLARCASCSVFAIRKMESGKRWKFPPKINLPLSKSPGRSGVSNACTPSFPVTLPWQPEKPD